MSLAAVKEKAATVLAVAADMLPPQMPKPLLQSSVVVSLGSVQIMVGLFNLGLGPGRVRTHPDDLADLDAAYWLGAVYLAAGIISVVADRLPFPLLVCFAVSVNVVGCIFAILGIVLYAIDLSEASVVWMCDNSTPGREDGCLYVAHFAQSLRTAMDITLIVMAVLQLAVCITFAVLGIKALVGCGKEEGDKDAEIHQPLSREGLLASFGS